MATHHQTQAAIADLKLAIEYRSVVDLRPHPRTPRKHPASQIRKLVAGINTHGFLVPLVVDQAGQVLAGHARLIAARQIGLSTVPAIRLEHLSDAQAQAFLVADSRLMEMSSWDDRILGEILLDLSMTNLEFSIEATGFDMGEIDFRIEALTVADPKPAVDTADQVEDSEGETPVSQLGDLWLLDRHRVLCGSSLEVSSYDTLMDQGKAAMIFSDPPYNVKIKGHVSGLGKIIHREFPMASGEMTGTEFIKFLRTALGLFARHSLDGSLHYICMDWRHLHELMEAGRGPYTELKNVCVWAKTNAGMGSLYRSQHELVLVYKNGRAPHRNNVELGKHGRNRTNVWNYAGPSSFGRKGEEGNLLALHPTVKPVQLVADAILDCTARGDIVLDGFLGSGSTVLAAERVGRRCFGLELDPLYVDTIIRRWQNFTGGLARHARSGLTFAEINDRNVVRAGQPPVADIADPISSNLMGAVR